jgi:HTH-type transcriptional regulator/antitoxin HigA
MEATIRLIPTGQLIAEYLDENSISQKQLATEAGYSEKQVSLIINNKVRLTSRFADALAKLLPGTTSSFWFSYDQKFAVQEEKENQEVAKLGYRQISANFGLDKIFKKSKLTKYERLSVLKEAVGSSFDDGLITNMGYRVQPAFLQDKSRKEKVNETYLETWVSVLTYLYSLKEYNGESLKSYVGPDLLKKDLYANHDLFAIKDQRDLFANTSYFCQNEGIKLILTKSAPSTYVRGAVYSNNGEIYLLLTNHYKSVEYTLFAFIHELFHLIQKDVTPDNNCVVPISNNLLENHEDSISKLARDFFISEAKYNDFVSRFVTSNNKVSVLLSCSAQEHITPGMLVTFLQHDGFADYASLRQFTNPLRDTGEFFDMSND